MREASIKEERWRAGCQCREFAVGIQGTLATGRRSWLRIVSAEQNFLDRRAGRLEDRAMSPPPRDSPYRAEWELLHALRDHPELLALVAAASGDELQLQTRLRREYDENLVRGAFALCELRRKATRKFSLGDRMWFDRQGFEQATSELVARHKALRFRRVSPDGRVWDLCSGVGGDTVALAAEAAVTAVDLNPAACLMTEWNAEVYGRAERVTTVCADMEGMRAAGDFVHVDPDRRRQGTGRAVRVEDYVPGLDALRRLTTVFRGGAIKLGPASNFGGKFPDAEVELISLDGECKEATMWFGDLRSDDAWRATVLPAGETLAGNPLDFEAALNEPQRYVFDPDPAVVRAGLVDAAAERLGLSRLDREEEYLTGPACVGSPFVQAFEVLALLPNNLTEIRNWFRTSQAGQVEIKCRHIPIVAETIRRRLPLPGDEPVVLIFARTAGKSRALVCRRVTASA
jgi:hypothetical protein